ncbi:hypothetical protein [Thalassobellus sediminis]
MNQKDTNQSTKIFTPFLGFGWYTGTSSRNNASTRERTFQNNNIKQL